MSLVVTDIWAVCEDPLCASHQHYGINLLSDSERKQMQAGVSEREMNEEHSSSKSNTHLLESRQILQRERDQSPSVSAERIRILATIALRCLSLHCQYIANSIIA